MAKSANSILARIGFGGLILMAIGSLITIGIQSMFFKPKTKTVTEYVPVDTCLSVVKIAELTSQDSISIHSLIEKRIGAEKVDRQLPSITKVESTNDSSRITTFEKSYGKKGQDLQFGEIRIKIKSTSPIEIVDFKHLYRVDSLIMKEKVKITNNVLLTPTIPQINIPTPELIEIPTLKEYTKFGISGSLNYTDMPIYGIGGYIETKHGLILSLEKYTNAKGGQIDSKIPLFKIK